MISKTLLAVSIDTFDRVWITCSVERMSLLVSVFVFPSDQIIIINKTPIIRLTGFPTITLLSAVSILILQRSRVTLSRAKHVGYFDVVTSQVHDTYYPCQMK